GFESVRRVGGVQLVRRRATDAVDDSAVGVDDGGGVAVAGEDGRARDTIVAIRSDGADAQFLDAANGVDDPSALAARNAHRPRNLVARERGESHVDAVFTGADGESVNRLEEDAFVAKMRRRD